MTVYEYNTNGAWIVMIVVLCFLALALAYLIVRFWPLLKTTVGLLRESSNATQVAFITVITVILYGALITGLVLCAWNAVECVEKRVDVRDTYSTFGRTEILQSEVIEYRGEVLGYAVSFCVDGQVFVITDPPGLPADAFDLFNTGVDAEITYSVTRGRNVITKIVIPIVDENQRKPST